MERRSQLLWIMVAMLALVPAELMAGTISGRTGASSRATISIEASVAPRMGFGGSSAPDPSGEPFCIWSNSPSRAFTITLQEGPDSRALRLGPASKADAIRLIPGKPVEWTARSSARACASAHDADRMLLRYAREQAALGDAGQPQRVVLILTPE